MALLSKTDLQYDYIWTTTSNDDPNIRGGNDRALFNRREGYEVLHFINTYCEEKGITSKKEALKIETMIHEELPSDIRRYDEIKDWITLNL